MYVHVQKHINTCRLLQTFIIKNGVITDQCFIQNHGRLLEQPRGRSDMAGCARHIVYVEKLEGGPSADHPPWETLMTQDMYIHVGKCLPLYLTGHRWPRVVGNSASKTYWQTTRSMSKLCTPLPSLYQTYTCPMVLSTPFACQRRHNNRSGSHFLLCVSPPVDCVFNWRPKVHKTDAMEQVRILCAWDVLY